MLHAELTLKFNCGCWFLAACVYVWCCSCVGPDPTCKFVLVVEKVDDSGLYNWVSSALVGFLPFFALVRPPLFLEKPNGVYMYVICVCRLITQSLRIHTELLF